MCGRDHCNTLLPGQFPSLHEENKSENYSLRTRKGKDFAFRQRDGAWRVPDKEVCGIAANQQYGQELKDAHRERDRRQAGSGRRKVAINRPSELQQEHARLPPRGGKEGGSVNVIQVHAIFDAACAVKKHDRKHDIFNLSLGLG